MFEPRGALCLFIMLTINQLLARFQSLDFFFTSDKSKPNIEAPVKASLSSWKTAEYQNVIKSDFYNY